LIADHGQSLLLARYSVRVHGSYGRAAWPTTPRHCSIRRSRSPGGTVTAFEWTNPHAYIELDVAEKDGKVEHLEYRLGSPAVLQQSGGSSKTSILEIKVTAVISPLRSLKPGGLLVQVTLPDGRVLGQCPGRAPRRLRRGSGALTEIFCRRIS